MEMEDTKYITLTIDDLLRELKEIEQKLENVKYLADRHRQVEQTIQLLRRILKEREGIDHVLKSTRPYENEDLLGAAYNYLNLVHDFSRTVDLANALQMGGFDFEQKDPYHQVYDRLTDSLNVASLPFVKKGSLWGLNEWVKTPEIIQDIDLDEDDNLDDSFL